MNHPDLKKALECLCLESSRTFYRVLLAPRELTLYQIEARNLWRKSHCWCFRAKMKWQVFRSGNSRQLSCNFHRWNFTKMLMDRQILSEPSLGMCGICVWISTCRLISRSNQTELRRIKRNSCFWRSLIWYFENHPKYCPYTFFREEWEWRNNIIEEGKWKNGNLQILANPNGFYLCF